MLLRDFNDEDRVRSGGFLVHVCGSHGSCSTAALQNLVNLVHGSDVELVQTLDVNALCLVLVHGQVVVVRYQQIANLLHVNLHVADFDGELDVPIAGHDRVEDLLDDSRNDTLGLGLVDVGAHHGVCLSRTSLAIGEDGAVVASQHIVDCAADRVVKDILLGGVDGEDSVEGEGRGGVLAGDSEGFLGLEADDLLAVCLALDAVLRPETGDDLDCVWGCHCGGGRGEGGEEGGGGGGG